MGTAYLAIFTRGNKLFELTNHLGNVPVTVTDARIPAPKSGTPPQVGSYTTQKKSFEDNQVRTARRNEFIQYINVINKELGAIKNGTKVDFSTLSRQVGRTGFEPTYYLNENQSVC
ncbi:hypothetical protein DC498_08015 [Terrimonas sp.]|uniref:hypothetical protein n=1 Tax=Terrimonas sp. TaxID=1914338 RepID=UPI000D51D606|nr:hypothetical protein [Terrimonas sp.]PVD52860.1 hypothetical protein DC498_08015 [Terrimonas sp.]